ncbi:MAG: TM1266 family iron-only hydrogenase system putative regulator [Salinivirgaceae bacterium]|jgi:putative iron-only hydrogenase system regulator
MEERIGSILIIVEQKDEVMKLNQIISDHSQIIIGRQGIQLKEKGKSIISLVLEGTTDQLGSLSGQLGMLKGIQVKSMVIKSN